MCTHESSVEIEKKYASAPVTPMVWSLWLPETERVAREFLVEETEQMFDDLRQAYDRPPCQLHTEFLNTWRTWSQIELGDAFPYQYVGAGSSEVIRSIIRNIGVYRLHVFEGEYEGYRHFAQAPVVVHPRSLSALSNYPFINSDQFWISHPSAIDGEYWQELEPFLNMLYERNPAIKVYLDVAYHGITRTPEILIPERFPNVAGVVFSLSKIFGVYRFRIGGCVSRQEIPALVGNQWFNNYLSLKLGTKLLKTFSFGELASVYQALQAQTVSLLKEGGVLPSSAVAANVLLLARSSEGSREFQRAPGAYRYCLTPSLGRALHVRGVQ